LRVPLGLATVALVGVGSVMAVHWSGGKVDSVALLAGWSLAVANAVATWVLNRWAMAGPSDRFVRRASAGLAVRLPLLVVGLLALLVLTHLQARSLLCAFFGGYFLAIVWEIVLLHKMANRA